MLIVQCNKDNVSSQGKEWAYFGPLISVFFSNNTSTVYAFVR